MEANTRAEYLEELRRANDLMERLVKNHQDWKIIIRNGLLAGLGTAIGATLLVSLLVWIIQPLGRLESFRPVLEEISNKLERGDPRKN